MRLKNFVKLTLVLIALSTALMSCDSLSGVNITEASQVTKFQDKIKEFVTPEMKVNEITFLSSGTDLTSIMGSVIIKYANPSDASLQKSMMINLANWKVIKEEDLETNPGDRVRKIVRDYNAMGALIANIDFSKIPAIIEAAAGEVVKHDVNYAGIGRFNIKFNSDPAQLAYDFSINAKPKEGATSIQGRNIVTNYYEMPFTADAAGNVTLNE